MREQRRRQGGQRKATSHKESLQHCQTLWKRNIKTYAAENHLLEQQIFIFLNDSVPMFPEFWQKKWQTCKDSTAKLCVSSADRRSSSARQPPIKNRYSVAKRCGKEIYKLMRRKFISESCKFLYFLTILSPCFRNFGKKNGRPVRIRTSTK